MSKMILALAVLSVSATAAFARLGEDLKQCATRYGQPVGNDEVRKVVSFSKNGFFITCHFKDAPNIQDRVCDSITFRHVDQDSGAIPLTPEEIKALLASNGLGRQWQAAGDPPSPDNFVTDDGSIYAHYDRDARLLIFATKEYKDAQEAAQRAATPGM